MMLPSSEACERNKQPILEVLQAAFAGSTCALEIGSGTGQHAVYFSQHLPWLTWQPTELAAQLEPLARRVQLEGPANLLPPRELDVLSGRPWPLAAADAVFSANTLHIMSWAGVEALFDGLGGILEPGGCLALYGPFRYQGAFTTASNAEFDAFLRRRDAASGLRDFEAVDALARGQGLELAADHAMPANNQLLLWRR